MHFSHCILAGYSVFLVFCSAAPTPIHGHLPATLDLGRPSNIQDAAVLVRRNTPEEQLSKTIVEVQRKQSDRIDRKKKNKEKNKSRRIHADFKTPDYHKLNKDKRKEADRVARQKTNALAHKELKAARGHSWATGSKGIIDPKKQTPQRTKEQKAIDKAARRAARKSSGVTTNLPASTSTVQRAQPSEVRHAFSKAAEKMRNTENIPGKADTFTVGQETVTGSQVRKAIFNAHLHADHPVGRGILSKHPKEFRNEAYGQGPTNPALRGQRPITTNHVINGATPQLYEYPVISSGNGWVGRGRVGPTRVIISDPPHHNPIFHGVIGHDLGGGGTVDDHYLATHTPKS